MTPPLAISGPPGSKSTTSRNTSDVEAAEPLFVVADFRVMGSRFRASKATRDAPVPPGLMGGVDAGFYAAPETFQNKRSAQALGPIQLSPLSAARTAGPVSGLLPGRTSGNPCAQHMTEPPDLSMLPEADREVVFARDGKESGRALAELHHVHSLAARLS